MILFQEDVEAINELLRDRAKLDQRLIDLCQEHIEHKQYTEVVRKAFLALEERVQQRAQMPGKTIGEIVGPALMNDKGAMRQKLGLDADEARSLRELLMGSFGLFRNPVSHPGYTILDYGPVEAQEVLGFVNLLLKIMDRGPLPPLKAALRQLQTDLGGPAADRVAAFLDRLKVDTWQIEPGKTGLHLKRPAYAVTIGGDLPKLRQTTVFRLTADGGESRITIPGKGYWDRIPYFDEDGYRKRLEGIGFQTGWGTELDLLLKNHNSAHTLDELYLVIRDITREMEASLPARADGR